MCDFSQYGGPSEEWLAVEKTLPALSYDTNADLIALRKTVNGGREEMSAAAMQVLGPLVSMVTYDIPTRDGSTVQARTYRPVSKPKDEKLPVYLYFHGGGFIFGTLDSEDAACALVAVKLGICVLNVNYRHTPEHVFPTAWNDAQDSFVWLHKNMDTVGGDASKVLVGGVSAGGQLAASLALEKHLDKSDVMKGLPAIAGQILIIPCTASPETYAEGPLKKMASPEISSYVENEHAPVLSKKTVEFFTGLLKVGPVDLKDTKVNIVNASEDEVRGMPPAVFGIAGLDPLRDEGLLYAKTLAEAGVPTEVRLFKGVPHGHRRFGDKLKASAAWDACVLEGITWCLGEPEASRRFEVKVV